MTIGHSTRMIDEFVSLLQNSGIELVIDIRTVPRSRHNPQFNRETLPEKLKESGIDYLHMAGMGGLRHTRLDSPNLGWRNLSFRGFADYMQTEDFRENITELSVLAGQKRVVLMCAEALPWRCHRSLISDALLIRGIPVEHIMSSGHIQLHKLTQFAYVEDLNITYPGGRKVNRFPDD